MFPFFLGWSVLVGIRFVLGTAPSHVSIPPKGGERDQGVVLKSKQIEARTWIMGKDTGKYNIMEKLLILLRH